MSDTAQGTVVRAVRQRALRTLGVAAATVTLLLSACASEPDPAGNLIVVSGATPASTATLVRPTAASSVLPAIQSSPTPRQTVMRSHKTFIDPPLPAELRDDGGLTPLPPPPPGPSTNR